MENKGPFLSALLFFLGILSAQAQIGKDSLSVEVSSYCSYDSGTGGDSTCKDVLRLRYEPYKRDDLLADVKKVLLTLGIAQNPQFGLINSQGVKALYCKQKSPLILINKNIADTYGKWELWGIAFHEVGHYANDHENLCSNPELELDADFFSGSCLAILGATKKETVECYLKITETELGSHPKRDLRIARALQGYDNILSSMKLKSFTSVNPVITWKKSKRDIQVSIDQKSYKLPKLKGFLSDEKFSIDPQLGILYLPDKNATYQLFNFNKANSGIGTLVNDRTSLVFIRMNATKFRIFNKVRIVTINQVLRREQVGDDYQITFKEHAGPDSLKIVLSNYYLTPSGLLRPCFFK